MAWRALEGCVGAHPARRRDRPHRSAFRWPAAADLLRNSHL